MCTIGGGGGDGRANLEVEKRGWRFAKIECRVEPQVPAS